MTFGSRTKGQNLQSISVLWRNPFIISFPFKKTLQIPSMKSLECSSLKLGGSICLSKIYTLSMYISGKHSFDFLKKVNINMNKHTDSDLGAQIKTGWDANHSKSSQDPNLEVLNFLPNQIKGLVHSLS